MKLIVGLGNPGAQYARNRHNIGFLAVEAIADAQGFGPWRTKFNGLVSEGRLGAEKALLLKPGTFMNLSGDSVRAAMGFFKLTPADVIVLHDELDLAPGRLRFKTGGGHAGHNGLRSIDAHVGAAFQRLRMGIGHPGDKRLVSNYVLGDFAKADEAWLDPLLAAVAAEAPLLASDGARFLTAVAARLAPPRPKAERPAEKLATPAPADGEAAPDAPMDALRRLAERFR
ncbi:aminoacyl-tRNA hydrolase [Amaricoccus solimangrovi]|uniref:Peptidyl-tRNA hydrolase n=1 Tax=Amaricoccus solimangrovi TaxID=2589815 RepID=A0A501WPH1_9RHOB|nr:aminoacyl-tRNA hydrolase [Amaricoccus solimangrovi]TPE50225.1 aminoacyl-tRNA hydrolase [Amaricoccus solimangrovi]